MQNSTDQTFSFGVVILAAGSSRRMGQPKLLLPWRNTTVLGHLLRSWQSLKAEQIGIVCAAKGNPLQEELETLQFPKEHQISNPDPDRGMFSSVQCAASWSGWKKSLTHWVVTLGDQPHVRLETLQALLKFGSANPEKICQPIRSGRYRHPVLLPRREFEALAGYTGTTLKEFLTERAGQLAGWESEDAGLDLDMDTPQDYERLRAIM